MKFVLLLGVALFCQGVEPSKGCKLFSFFHNFLACRASTIIDRFRCKETRRESFHSFFRDIIEACLYARGRIGLTVPPLTTPEITTPPNELNYWKSFGRKITGLLKAAVEKYLTNPPVVPVTIRDLHSLEETLVWRWYATELQKITNTVVGKFVTVDEQ